MTESNTKRTGPWKKGESGNPAGRKPGTGEVAKIRARISARVPDLLAALMEAPIRMMTEAHNARDC